MRIEEKAGQSLIDIPLLQAARMGLKEFENALNQGHFDPFPSGEQAIGEERHRGSILPKSQSGEQLRLLAPVMSSFDGALPDYLLEALIQGLHNDDSSLRDFLAIFDRRLLELHIRSARTQILVAGKDNNSTQVSNIISRMLVSVSHEEKSTHIAQILMPLLSRSRSLDMLRRIVSWWTERPVRINATFGKPYPIDNACLPRLSAKSKSKNQSLGNGTMLGRFGQIPVAHIGIHLQCNDRNDLTELTSDQEGMEHLNKLVAQYLRDASPVTIFAEIKRRHLSRPRLSSSQPTDRLGAYSILDPLRQPEKQTSIQLIQRMH
ncbi:type VI secretion system baseplate subunit TssG [Flexibacterium corallicola]|uniref:type VI secretion system baseplate subunit TssG n=1 Tax=Flexibacterium corallicola TaxID=3037259 RepID=UPI00286EDFD3|nr:type VI secretion system baseplate subunit TssG [Pseudovibrio sp. M1P-2-3]